MDQFLIDISLKSKQDRCLPFPDFLRETKSNNSPSKSEHDKFIHNLTIGDRKTIDFVTNIDLGIVEHNAKSIHPNITEYEFKYPYVEDTIRNIRYPKRWYLFHGSPVGNWHSILRSGIKNMSGTRFMSTGQAYGPGVYLTDSLNLASSYGRSGSTHCVAVIELLVDPSAYLKAPNIYVVPDDSVLFPRYLYYIRSVPKGVATDILEYYKRVREGQLQVTIRHKRLAIEQQLLGSSFIKSISDTLWIVGGSVKFYCYLVNFPMKAPLFQLTHQLETANDLFDSIGFYKYNGYTEWSPNLSVNDLLNQINEKIKCSQTSIEYSVIATGAPS